MNFGFTQEQDLLRGEVRKFVAQRCPMEKVREIIRHKQPTFDGALWGELVEMGLAGLTVSEAHGGAGLSLLDLVVVLEELGRGLVPLPVLTSALAAHAIRVAGDEAQQARYLPRIAQGAVATVALLEGDGRLDAAGIGLTGRVDGDGFVLSGAKHFVDDAGAAELFVVAFRTGDAPEALSLAVLERGEGVSGESYLTMDRTKPAGNLVLDGARVPASAVLGEVGGAWEVIQGIYDRGAVLVTAEAIGTAEAAHAMTVEYAKTRVQFGSVIGRYQGVKHPLAEMYVDLESIKSLTYYAAWLADHRSAELPVAASRAKAYAADAFVRIGIDAIQLHGAIGYTSELDAQLYMKRAKYVRPAFGDADYHFDRVLMLSEEVA